MVKFFIIEDVKEAVTIIKNNEFLVTKPFRFKDNITAITKDNGLFIVPPSPFKKVKKTETYNII